MNTTVNGNSLTVVMKKMTVPLTSASEFASGKLVDAYKSQMLTSFLVIDEFLR